MEEANTIGFRELLSRIVVFVILPVFILYCLYYMYIPNFCLINRKYLPSQLVKALRFYFCGYYHSPIQNYPFESDSYIVHDSNIVDEIVRMYKNNGFKTDVLLKNPFKHSGPTLIRRISFPLNQPKQSNGVSCDYRSYRIHIELTYMRGNGKLVSIPHIEPDPTISPITHILDGYIKGKVIIGKPATDVLKQLLGIGSEGDRDFQNIAN